MMNKVLYGLASPFHLVAFVLIIQSCWAIAYQNDECETAQLLKPRKRNCSELLTRRWHKIKCIPFVFGARKHSCSERCNKLQTCFDGEEPSQRPCLAVFRKLSSNQFNGTGNITFCVEPCRAFVFRIRRLISNQETLNCSSTITTDTVFKRIKDFIHILQNISDNDENALQNVIKRFKTVINEMRPFRPAEEGEDPIFVTLAFEEFMTRIAKSILNSTNPEIDGTGKDVAFRVRRIVRKKGSDFLFNDSDGENFIKIPSANLHPNGSVVLGMAYKSLHQLFPGYVTDPGGTNKKRILDSIILSAVVDPPLEKLRENVTLVFKNMKAGQKKRTCVFWKFSEDNCGSWSSEGCQTRVTSHSLTECVCNHLTHFAVLMDFTDKDGEEKGLHDKALTLLTRVGMALSLTGIFLTIISYLQLTDRASPLCHIRVSLTSCIGAGHIIFFAGIDATGNKGACVSVAALEQYFVMVAFCWMLVEGIYFYLFVVKLYNITDDIRRYHGCCWGVPAIIVAVSLGIAAGKDGLETFVRDKNCWMSATNNIIWIFISFVGLTVIINIAILVRVIKEMTTIQQVNDNQAEQIRLGVHASVALAPLLGFTWLIGFLLPLHVAFSYIFVILNSAQGFSIFFFHCLRNSEIKERFKRRCWFIKADNKITPQVNQSQDNAEIPEASSEQRF